MLEKWASKISMPSWESIRDKIKGPYEALPSSEMSTRQGPAPPSQRWSGPMAILLSLYVSGLLLSITTLSVDLSNELSMAVALAIICVARPALASFFPTKEKSRYDFFMSGATMLIALLVFVFIHDKYVLPVNIGQGMVVSIVWGIQIASQMIAAERLVQSTESQKRIQKVLIFGSTATLMLVALVLVKTLQPLLSFSYVTQPPSLWNFPLPITPHHLFAFAATTGEDLGMISLAMLVSTVAFVALRRSSASGVLGFVIVLMASYRLLSSVVLHSLLDGLLNFALILVGTTHMARSFKEDTLSWQESRMQDLGSNTTFHKGDYKLSTPHLGAIASVIGLLALLQPHFFHSFSVNTRGNTKWIVVTTINSPTTTMEAICNLPDFEVVVVADLKTPKDWKCGACHFLSVDAQARLPFQSISQLPYRAYTRKNIGYLFAIANGAKTIFDTDDDNLPTEPIVMQDYNDNNIAIGFPSHFENTTTINPYWHFGRPDIWPRGYPLENFDQHETIQYFKNGTAPPELGGKAMVQQGLADLDPDVDAIFRLLNAEDIAQVKFWRHVPTLQVARGVLAPFNSQNTLWHEEAFWGLLLPTSVTFRATDIVRGYWVQRILWDIGGALSFRKPSVDQIRNPHDYMEDFVSEEKLYTQSYSLSHFLRKWTSPSTHIPDRIADLFVQMKREQFIGRSDLILSRAWNADLTALGYKFPKVEPWRLEKASKEITLAPPVTDVDVAWANMQRDMRRPTFSKSLLIVLFNHPWYDNVEALQELYSPFFPNLVFYGPVKEQTHPLVKQIEIDRGFWGYEAMRDALQNHPGYEGYIYTSDDCAINPFLLANLDPNLLWRAPNFDWTRKPLALKDKHPQGEWYNFLPVRMANYDNALKDIPKHYLDQLKSVSPNNELYAYGGMGDFAYVPARLSGVWLELLGHMRRNEVFLELVWASITKMLPANETIDLIPKSGYVSLWGEGRKNWSEAMKPNLYVFHPVKLSWPNAVQRWKQWYIDSAKTWTRMINP